MTNKEQPTWTHWIFDLDGTLTHAIHDFDAIREELGLAEGAPILESLAKLPTAEAEPLHRRLKELEWELAKQAKAQESARPLLAALEERQCQVGILTRNNRANAIKTLRACGLLKFFSRDSILGRTDAAPKPSPEGVLQLLEQWDATPENAVLIGDYQFDLLAGQNAGTATVYADFEQKGEWNDLATLTVHSLEELLPSIPPDVSDEKAQSEDAKEAEDSHKPQQRIQREDRLLESPQAKAKHTTPPPPSRHSEEKEDSAEDGLQRLARLGFAELVDHLQASHTTAKEPQTPEEQVASLVPALAEVLHPILDSLAVLQVRVEQLEAELATYQTAARRSGIPHSASTDLIFPDTTVTPAEEDHPGAAEPHDTSEPLEEADIVEASEASEASGASDARETREASDASAPDSPKEAESAAVDAPLPSGMRDFSQYDAEAVSESDLDAYTPPMGEPEPYTTEDDEPPADPGRRIGVIVLLLGFGFLLMVCAKFIWPLTSQQTPRQNTSTTGSQQPQTPTQRRAIQAPKRSAKVAAKAQAPARTPQSTPREIPDAKATPTKRTRPKPRRRKRRSKRRRKKGFSLPSISAKLPLAQRCDICTKKLYVQLQDKTTKQQTKDFFAHCNALCNQSWFLFRKRFFHWCSFTKLGQSQYCPQELKQYQSAYNQQTWLNQ